MYVDNQCRNWRQSFQYGMIYVSAHALLLIFTLYFVKLAVLDKQQIFEEVGLRTVVLNKIEEDPQNTYIHNIYRLNNVANL